MNVTRVGSKLLLTVSEDELGTLTENLDDGGIMMNQLRPYLSAGPSLPPLRSFITELEALLLTETLTTDHNLNRAAKALGFKHHQSLISLLNSRRHKGLREVIGLAPSKTRNRPLHNQKTGERVTPPRRRSPKMHVATTTELAAQ